MADQRWPEACDKLEESYRIEPLPGVLLNLAVCHEAEGRTATAWTEFKESLALAKIDRRQDRLELAEKHIADLEPRLARLRIDVTAAPAGLAVRDGDTTLPPAVWGAARPVDPGPHTIAAEAPGYRPFTSTKEAAAAQLVVVTVPSLEPVQPPTPAAPLRPPPAARPAPSPPPLPPPPPEASAWPIVGYSLLGLGGATLLVGGAFGIHALRREAAAEDVCTEAACPDAGSLAISDEANTFATAANATLIAGAVLAGAGVVTLVVAPDQQGPTVTAGPGGLRLSGRF